MPSDAFVFPLLALLVIVAIFWLRGRALQDDDEPEDRPWLPSSSCLLIFGLLLIGLVGLAVLVNAAPPPAAPAPDAAPFVFSFPNLVPPGAQPLCLVYPLMIGILLVFFVTGFMPFTFFWRIYILRGAQARKLSLLMIILLLLHAMAFFTLSSGQWP
jgi:heme A synthase